MVNEHDYKYDLFISYNRTDEEWAERLATRLEQENYQGHKLKVFFAPWYIRPGESINERLDSALTDSHYVGLVLSQEAVDSRWVKEEWYSTHYAGIKRNERRLIPLCLRSCEIPPFLDHLNRIDFRDDDKFEDGISLLLAVLRDEPLPRHKNTDEVEVVSASGPVPQSLPSGYSARRRILLACSLLAAILLAVLALLILNRQNSSSTPPVAQLQPTPYENPVTPQQLMPTPMPTDLLSFESAKKKLGKPKTGNKPEMVYQARHDYAMLIWIDGNQDFYVLKENQKLVKVRGENVEQDTWYFDDENRERTGTPAGKDPPYGTFAIAWMSNRDWWNREVGWRAWHCQYTKGVVRVQWFEHGVIVGDLRRMKEDYRVAVYVLLIDDDMWAVDMPERHPPQCENPATNKADLELWLKKHPRS